MEAEIIPFHTGMWRLQYARQIYRFQPPEICLIFSFKHNLTGSPLYTQLRWSWTVIYIWCSEHVLIGINLIPSIPHLPAAMYSFLWNKSINIFFRNNYYGADTASLSLHNLFQKFRNTDPPATLGHSRDWNVDLVPKVRDVTVVRTISRDYDSTLPFMNLPSTIDCPTTIP